MSDAPIILVCGGAGYIGTHMCLALLQDGYNVVALDNFENSNHEGLDAIQALAQQHLTVVNADIRDQSALDDVFATAPIQAVIHLAGLKSAAESKLQPAAYYDNNLVGTVALAEAMDRAQCFRLVFASSAAVYGVPQLLPIVESHVTNPTSPYGRTKLMAESYLQDLSSANEQWCISILRYFNAVGAHQSGAFGEQFQGAFPNLFSALAQVAVGERSSLPVYGSTYATRDGTPVRDYIHVDDLIQGHLAALNMVLEGASQCAVHNLGTGTGYSVLEVIAAFETVVQRAIAYEITDKRPGDVAESYADTSKAQRDFGWDPRYGLDRMCSDAWRWHQHHASHKKVG